MKFGKIDFESVSDFFDIVDTDVTTVTQVKKQFSIILATIVL